MAWSSHRRRARRVLEVHERMTLIGADRDAFLKSLMDPPVPTEKLVAALRRHRLALYVFTKETP